MKSQDEKGREFYALHQRGTAFVIPNPWDIGTARLLTQVGFEALATTSGGYAFSLGLRDGAVSREQMMQHVSAIADATDLPVSADLENGFGDSPKPPQRPSDSRPKLAPAEDLSKMYPGRKNAPTNLRMRSIEFERPSRL